MKRLEKKMLTPQELEQVRGGAWMMYSDGYYAGRVQTGAELVACLEANMSGGATQYSLNYYNMLLVEDIEGVETGFQVYSFIGDGNFETSHGDLTLEGIYRSSSK
jgi:hypothetical protein